MATAHEYQTAAFFGLVILFEILERVRPAREIDRWKDLKIDVLSFALALGLNRACKLMVGGSSRPGRRPLWPPPSTACTRGPP